VRLPPASWRWKAVPQKPSGTVLHQRAVRQRLHHANSRSPGVNGTLNNSADQDIGLQARLASVLGHLQGVPGGHPTNGTQLRLNLNRINWNTPVTQGSPGARATHVIRLVSRVERAPPSISPVSLGRLPSRPIPSLRRPFHRPANFPAPNRAQRRRSRADHFRVLATTSSVTDCQLDANYDEHVDPITGQDSSPTPQSGKLPTVLCLRSVSLNTAGRQH
jgi:hypothetical protein